MALKPVSGNTRTQSVVKGDVSEARPAVVRLRRTGRRSGQLLSSRSNKVINELGFSISLDVPDNGNEARYYVRGPNDHHEYLFY